MGCVWSGLSGKNADFEGVRVGAGFIRRWMAGAMAFLSSVRPFRRLGHNAVGTGDARRSIPLELNAADP